MSTSRVNKLGAPGVMQLVGQAIATGGATASLTVSNLDLTTDGLYYFEVSIKNNSGTGRDIAIVVSGDSVATNYYRQFMYGDGGVLTTLRQNTNLVYGGLPTLQPLMIDGTMRIDRTNFARIHYYGSASPASTMSISSMVMARTVTGNVTSFAITSTGVFQDGDYVKIYKIAGAGATNVASGDSITSAAVQSAHGLSVGMPIYMNIGGWVQSNANYDASMCDAIVSEVTDANNFVLIQAGALTLTTGQWDSRTGDSGGLTKGEYYFISTTTGGLTKTAPTTGFSQCIGKAESTTVMRVMIGPVIALGLDSQNGVQGLLASATVSGAAATTLTVSGLDLNSDEIYYVVIKVKNATVSQSNLSLYEGSDTTAANYRRQASTSNSTTQSSSQGNDAAALVVYASSYTEIYGNITLDIAGSSRFKFNSSEHTGTNLRERTGTILHSVVGNVTSLTLSASVASSLDVGTSIKVYKVAAQVTAGTVFPITGLLAGQRYFRTDLGLDCYYDGTRWLTVQEYSFATITQGSWPATNTNDFLIRMDVPTDYQIYLTRFGGVSYVATTNDGTKYWTFPLVSLDSANAVISTISSPTTQSDAITTWVAKDATLNMAVDVSARSLRISATKTSTPGLGYFVPQLLYRKIIT
jgi:hypothetical protein